MPQTPGSVDITRGENLKRTLRSYKKWKDIVHKLADDGAAWPSEAALKAKGDAVDGAARELFDNMIACTSKAIPYMHDMLHNELYYFKDVHARNAEGQEHKGKENKDKGRDASNGKEQDPCTSIMRGVDADEAVRESTPQPLSQHERRIQEKGHVCTPAKLEQKCHLHYGMSPDFSVVNYVDLE